MGSLKVQIFGNIKNQGNSLRYKLYIAKGVQKKLQVKKIIVNESLRTISA